MTENKLRRSGLFDDGALMSSADFNSKYFLSHLITYLGNKRRLLPFIDMGVAEVKKRLGKEKITAVDGFAGSGVVSRLLKYHTIKLISNDFEQYAKTVNEAYLRNRSTVDFGRLTEAIEYLNKRKMERTGSDYFITKNYAPVDDENIKAGERVFYTRSNAQIIDNVRYMIEKEVPEDLRVFCLAQLIIKASIHNNTSGVFKGFHKKDGVGHFGGAGENALARIMGEISLEVPIFAEAENETKVYCEDINKLINEIEPVDLAYYDPPYNQHPYGSNYFMLNIINGGKPVPIQGGVSGIVQEWQRSDYNSAILAEKAMDELIGRTPAKYILVSYNNEGIIPIKKFEEIVARHGEWELMEQEYNTYRGSRNLRARSNKVRELLWVIKKK